jgi:hypothetical protein
MKKSFLLVLASICTLGLSSSLEAWVSYDPFFDVFFVSSYSYRPVTIYRTPVYVEMDPKAALVSAGISAGALSLVLGIAGIGQLAQACTNSPEKDGGELPRGILSVSGAVLVGALAALAFQAAAK